eukprot:g3984.t1
MRRQRGLMVASMLAFGGSAARTPASSTASSALGVIEDALLTTAKGDFGGHSGAFEAAVAWSGERLRAGRCDHQEDHQRRAPHLGCADYERGRKAYSLLQDRLSPEAVRPVVHSEEHGACYFAAASHDDAATILDSLPEFGLRSFAPFPTALKVAPGLLEHGHSNGTGRLSARHGAMMRKDNVEGLSVELAPGTLPASCWEANAYIKDLMEDLVSESMDLHATNFWSDPEVAEGEHLSTPEGAARGRDWSKAAAVVHGLSEAAGTSPADICSWNGVRVYHAGDDLLEVAGLDHLLFSRRGAGGTNGGGEEAELHVACFMGLVSFLAGQPEVLRVASRHTQGLLNAAARANIQTATITDTPLTDAGLDGTGEVIQVIDTGLDETSCFFVHDDTGDQIEHGYFFDEFGANVFTSLSESDDQWWLPKEEHHTGSGSEYSVISSSAVFTGGDFSFYPERRKLIQYINLIKSDDEPQPYGESFETQSGGEFPWLPADDFEYDDKAGHGTHTAGSAAGATLNNPAETVTCENGTTLSCVGGCIFADEDVDDLVTTSFAEYFDIDRLCPAYGCDPDVDDVCLSDDVSETLTNNGGMAQGAKLAIFDAFYGEFGLMSIVGNYLWEPCAEAGCRVHSNSWGGDYECQLSPLDIWYDEFMFENPENLLVFAAGNLGDEVRSSCTIGSPAIAKNVLAVGASTSGSTQLSATAVISPLTDTSGLDEVAAFSSEGPTRDGRIKPEVVAPGDMIYSAASDGEEEAHTCRLWAYAGTSMSCPIVAGAAAMVRQYFLDTSFYAADVSARGLCGGGFQCGGFSPSSATVKALFINSANLMGGSSEPDGARGFGRIHMEAGMPLAGNGSLVLFVADAANTTIPELTLQEYNFTVDGNAGLDFRATLSWIDPPASTFSTTQIVHDLDLEVLSPSGVTHTMWLSGEADVTNVNERVVVDAADVESGVWRVSVRAKRLSSDSQSYSLVVNGAISAVATGEGAAAGEGDGDDFDESSVGFPVVISSSTPSDDDSFESELEEVASSSGWRVLSPTAVSNRRAWAAESGRAVLCPSSQQVAGGVSRAPFGRQVGTAMLLRLTRAVLVASASTAFAASTSSTPANAPCPPLSVVEDALLTTAKSDFGGHSSAFEEAAAWNGKRLRVSTSTDQEEHPRAPHLCCTDYEHGRKAYSLLQDLLSPEAVRLVIHSEEHGACYLATASHADAATISENVDQFRVRSIAPFPSALKVAPGLLEHGHSNGPGRLSVRHGAMMRKDNVEGLSVELAPGTLPAASWEADAYMEDMLRDLMLESRDLQATNFWSDPAMAGEHLATPEGAAREQDWSKAAAVVHALSEAANTSPGDICSWNSVRVYHAGDDLLLVSGLDHLLYSGRGAGGKSQDGEAAELHVACFMGLVSFLAGRLEVLRVASRHTRGVLNAVARANIQSATITDTPLTDAGLDGSGQLIQIVDTGLDETSCFFVHDDTGDQIAHGYYYDEMGTNFLGSSYSEDDNRSLSGGSYDDDPGFFSSAANQPAHHTGYSSSYQSEGIFSGGDFSVFPDRRKVVQYINLVQSDDVAGPNVGSWTSSEGQQFPWLPADEFEYDDKAGHGTHTAGSAAGATLNNPAELVTCEAGKTVSCVGGCVDDGPGSDDDLVSFFYQYADIDRLCPAYGCDPETDDVCLSGDVSETLTQNGGMAQGAKLAIFDVFHESYGLLDFLGNGAWEPCAEAGCKLHSNSWGGDVECLITPLDLMYDEYMYENTENLLVFAAGNSGQSRECTMSSPATAKNVLAVGATLSGNTRFNVEGILFPGGDEADIDTVAIFSSSGPTLDGRVKPELVAPGDMIYSAASDGEEESHSCRLWAYAGTSMSCPIVAGASAMARQYFVDGDFYAADMTARAFCDEWSGCEPFSPSSATVKALLINSANLMGGSAEPDGSRGFGRIHMEAGMPLAGDGSLALFVADANHTSTPELTRQEYNFDVDADAGLDFRVTLSWIDPPAATTLASKQLVHDLDLAVISPSGVRYTMWDSGRTDTVNVNERVIVDAADVETGVWSVWVWAKRLAITDEQSYSLVVNGAISPATDVGAIERSSSASSSGSVDSASPADPGVGAATSGSLAATPAASTAAGTAATAATSTSNSVPYPSLQVFEGALRTTAKADFGGHSKAFEEATAWDGVRLSDSPSPSRGGALNDQGEQPRAPHLCCVDYQHGREAYSLLKGQLSPGAVRPVANSEQHGACYVVTASHEDTTAILENSAEFGLQSFGPFPSALKIAPGILEHDQGNGHGRLGARHGALMRKDNAEGLSVELAPGTLPAHSWQASSFIQDLIVDLMSESMDLHATNFWSDPAKVEREHLATPEGAARARDWSKAAVVVHGLSEAAGTSPADICSWDSVRVHHAGNDLLLVSGLDHLLYSGRGAGGTNQDGEEAELHVACFMGLVSFLAGRPEVLRVASRHTQGLLNAAARANIQTATITDTPLTDAGLDGTGQVVQVIDTGVDESSCFFAHEENGEHVPHGYYFDEWGINFDFPSASDSPTDDDRRRGPGPVSGSSSIQRDRRPISSTTTTDYQYVSVFEGGDFTVYPDRRKIIQYINLIKSDDEVQSHGSSFITDGGEQFPWLPAEEFEYDYEAGHGTHTAGSVAGATLNNPAVPVTCETGETVSCVGGCIDDNTAFVSDDDLVSSAYQYADIDRLCPLSPLFGCDESDLDLCLGDDVSETLTENGGMARGAKMAIFDAFYGDFGLMTLVGNDLWEPCAEADCKLHSNSWGGDYECGLGSNDVLYDEFMYENPENLLIFAAGNYGDESRSTCTILSPAIAKNVLAVGATISGATRLSATWLLDPDNVDYTDINTVAYFSSYGPTEDGRIKPEVMAPGDMVYSAASDGSEDSYTCRLWAYPGTSMSCPIVAGGSAMVRQYFMDDAFYATDMTERGFCDEWSGCEPFRPSAATIKALFINSANLMGGSSEPDGVRGFGRIHMEAGMPLAGDGSLVLFVADAANTTIPELTRQEYNFDVDADAGLDFRATLSWIDPPASTLATKQQVHDLDLAVISPSGERYTMWASGITDTVNVNERVIVDAADIETGVWSVWVWAKRLTTDEQSYSLVVNGAISPATDIGAIERSYSTSSTGSDSASPADPGIATQQDSSNASPAVVPAMFGVIMSSVLVFASAAKSGSNRACSSWARSAASGKNRLAGLSGNRALSSFFPRRAGNSDSMIVYGIVGLNVAGTVAVFLNVTQGTGGPFMFRNFMVSTYTTLTEGRLHTLFTSNFSHSNLWNGAIFSYMMYALGPTAIQQLGRRHFLALYLLGGAFSQLCQVVGPGIARRLGLPTVLQVEPYFISSGGSGAVLAVLAWYCASFPGSQIILLVVPVQTGVAGALYLGATLYQVVTNGAQVPFLGGPTQEIWRTLGAAAAGVLMAAVSRGRGGGRYKFIQRY